MEDNVTILNREIKRMASKHLAAKAAGDFEKLMSSMEELTELFQNYLDRGRSIEELSLTLAGGQVVKAKKE